MRFTIPAVSTWAKAAHQPIGKRRQPVHDHHGASVDGGLDCRGPGRRDNDIGCRQHIVGLSLHDGHRPSPVCQVGKRRKRSVLEMRRAGHDELDAGYSRMHEQSRADQVWQNGPHLVRPAAWQQRDSRRRWIELACPKKLRSGAAGLGELQKGVPNELGLDSSLSIDRLLEREDHPARGQWSA